MIRMQKHLIFVVVSVLVVALSYSWFEAFAVPQDPKWGASKDCVGTLEGKLKCCWDEPDILNPGETIKWCQACDPNGGNCGEVSSQSPQPTGPFAPPQDGVLEQPPTPPPTGPRGGLGNVPLDGGVLQQPPAEQGAAELPVVCSEEAGLELDEETDQCVPIESPVTEEPEAPEEPEEEQSEPEEEQPSEESDSSDDSNN